MRDGEWMERVIKARERFERGVNRRNPVVRLTKKDVGRIRNRVLCQVVGVKRKK
jgi:hypothetical protein